MDDSARKVTNQNQPVQDLLTGDTNVQQPTVSIQDQTQIVQPPVQTPASDQTGIGSIHKEQGPAVYQEPVQKFEKQQGEEEYLKPSEIETLPKEVQESGVEVIKNHEVASFIKQTGIEPAKESTPVSTSPSVVVKLPMTEKEALRVIKTTSIKDSKHWMAVLIEKIYEQWRMIKLKVK